MEYLTPYVESLIRFYINDRMKNEPFKKNDIRIIMLLINDNWPTLFCEIILLYIIQYTVSENK